jgi:autotransporter-associated beta strand protein
MSSSESPVAEGQNHHLCGGLRRRYSQLPTSSLLPQTIVRYGSRPVLFIGVSLIALCIGSQRSDAAGGNGGTDFFQSAAPGIGGSGPNGGAGTAGGTDSFFAEGAGGGGGGAGGGDGGAGGAGSVPGTLGGAGGVSLFPNGSPGNDTSTTGDEGAGGGGGGFNGFNGPTLNNAGVLKGGNGGAGGNSLGHGGGGGGGEGGYGANITSSVAINSGTVSGGTGGKGGDSDAGLGGSGGDGGIGIFFGGPASLINSGTIQGGTGGVHGFADFGLGSDGAGGAGIVGGGLFIFNSSVIRGGLSGDGVTRANAITFTGGINLLEVQAGSAITGNVIAFSAADTFRLGGNTNSSFNASTIGPAAQYRGFGVFEKNGTSTWSLTGTPGNNTPWAISQGTLLAAAATNVFGATSAITVNPLGTLDIGGFNQQIGSLTGNGTVTNSGVSAPAVLTTGADNTSTTFGGLAKDGSSMLGLAKIGNGNFILSGANTYTGGTSLNAGSISIGNISALGTGSLTFAGTNAALESTVTGSLANAIIINSGSATIGASAGQTLTIGAAAPIQYLSGAGTTLHFGSATDTGTIQLNGRAGSIITTGGAISVDGGTLQQGTVNGNFFISSALGGLTVGSGATAAALDLNGLPTMATNLTGTNSGVILNNGAAATLTVDNTANTTFAGTIKNGTGVTALAKTGVGTLSLSGTNTYTGVTTISAGTLGVNGSIASSSLTTVNAGGTLGGNGIVGNTTINGGTLAPGNSIGLLTVQGSLVFAAASSYMVEVSPANADRVNVSGTATLGGATVNASFAAGTYVAKQYTIVNATGGVSGTFGAQVNTNLPSGFHSSLSYDANDAYLNLALNFVPPPSGGLSGNQQNVANAIVGFFNSNGSIPIVFGGLTPAGLTQISGETATGSQQTTFDAMNLFIGLLTDPFVAGRGDVWAPATGAAGFAEESDVSSAYASAGRKRTGGERDAQAMITKAAPRNPVFYPRWSVWAAGFGGSQTTDGNAALGSNTATSRVFGVAAGADYLLSPRTIAGFALAGGGTNFTVNGSGSGRSDLFQAGAFIRHTAGPAYISAALAYGWQDVTTDRTVTVAGADRLRAEFNANAFSGRVEGGYRFLTPWMGITPYAAGQFTTFSLPAYAEQVLSGANTFALTYGAKDVTASRSELGLRSDRSFAMQDGIFTLRGRAAWAHNFNTDRSISATFQTLPGASFVVNGAMQSHDAALATASAEMKWLNGFSLAATFEGEFSDVTKSYAGKGVARYSW